VSPPDANSIEPDALASLRDWLVGEGLEGASLSGLLEGFATRLRAAGVMLTASLNSSQIVA
jgi:hypothetical protein